MFHDELSAEAYIRKQSEQLVSLILKDMKTGSQFKYNPSMACFELVSKRPKLW
jgi:hypothetical protein